MVPAANIRCDTKRDDSGSQRIEVRFYRIGGEEFSLNDDGNN
jgi:hypothetical protein